MFDKQAVLSRISFGHRIAEDETDVLGTYFVETDQWNRLYTGAIDVIYGPKGSGKSALYALLLSKSEDLRIRGISLIPGENPRGAPAFKDLAIDPPTTEQEFVALWKLYAASLAEGVLTACGASDLSTLRLTDILQSEGLVKGSRSLGNLLQRVMVYVRNSLRKPASIEAGVQLDLFSGTPTGVSGKIVFSEADCLRFIDSRSVEDLLELANNALANKGVSTWILLDRLDVAFAEDIALETNALRALFRAYLDMASFANIKLKIFLRSDIWSRISESGFREASHVSRSAHITWNRTSLLNLIIKRLIHNTIVSQYYKVNTSDILESVNSQEQFFYRVCPEQVDVGSKQSRTIDWVLSHTRDGSKLNAPRELIHFFNSLREVQAKRFEIGEAALENEQLFARPAFKDALPEVSQVRVEQTLYAEYPDIKPWIEQLRNEKTRQSAKTLSSIWQVEEPDALARAMKLANIGFFEIQGTKQAPEFWVPFLYRDFLNLIQGAAEPGLSRQGTLDDES